MNGTKIFGCALLLLAGCGEKDGDDSASGDDTSVTDDTAATSDSGSGSDSGTADDTSDTDSDDPNALPDLTEGLDEDYCDVSGSFPDSSGATSYFYGSFTKDDADAWSGQERWILFATAEWEASGGGDCEVVWDLTGSETSAGSCAGCEYGVAFDAVLNVGLTTCGETFTEGEETFSVTYGVDDLGGGASAVHYASSGNQFGSGHISETAFNYITDRSCVWF